MDSLRGAGPLAPFFAIVVQMMVVVVKAGRGRVLRTNPYHRLTGTDSLGP